MLTEVPPVPYDLISAKLGIPVGSIGPSRGRCLEKLRHDAAIATSDQSRSRVCDRELSHLDQEGAPSGQELAGRIMTSPQIPAGRQA